MELTLFPEDERLEYAVLERLVKKNDAKMWKAIHKKWKLEDLLRDVRGSIGWERFNPFGPNDRPAEQVQKLQAENRAKRDRLISEIAVLEKDINSYKDEIYKLKLKQNRQRNEKE